MVCDKRYFAAIALRLYIPTGTIEDERARKSSSVGMETEASDRPLNI